MIIVHYLENSRAHRILWLLEELGVPYDINVYRRGSDMRAPASLKAVHPLGKSPVIEDGGKVIAESGAIIEYLIDTYGGEAFRPVAGSDERLRYTYFLHYAEGSAMPLLVMKLVFAKLPSQVPLFIRPIAALIAKGAARSFIDPQLEDHVAFWESELARDGYFAGGEFSAADIAMSFPVEAAMSRMEQGRERPLSAVRRYLEAIRARPAYQRALARGGAYSYATT
ncbi:glutathione S-transferase [Rhizobium sp. KAs_5_22]|uniref:glutathione S-transferase family protein n=1 Tax=Ciceribacter selenitireducens TaxID=448181 RepID=UPI00048C5F20|nr:glutathione S-transferase [Ciceribacter selenitireducens]PPJ46055.1 glutathione S-transferase [Rhizobium sp. KAs_5_22]